MDPPPTDFSTGHDFLDSIMRCGLYLGAVFQIICLAAVVMAPDRAGDSSVQGKELEGSDDEVSDHSTPQATPRRPPHAHHRQRRQEKKKRR
ncbi:Protein anon-73B1 [Frankliniella fusca]|uniref:Protein anon-73B1 n=1 Tax=Frankliniella fusca TaxID=407009 RepID=A0AAE1I0E4_9NEOP|nr:Protein anon-73B1 [Frankliniella fusca]